MSDFKIIDKSGTWFLNSARFPFVDPESGARFEPGVKTKAKATDWTALQADWLLTTDDPLAEPEAEKKPEKAEK